MLVRSGGWIIEREIRGTERHDGMGCYPLFLCRDWAHLEADLDDLEGELVSLTVVTDPFGSYDVPLLRRCFRDMVSEFKQHYVIDLRADPESFIATHHRRNASRALRTVEIEHCAEPPRFLEEWSALYDEVIGRHQIRGVAAFTRRAFAEQLRVPGVVLYRAAVGGHALAMTLWYVSDGIGYYHLGAGTQQGYDQRAFFGMFWTAIADFAARGVRWLDLGGAAGIRAQSDDGLARFKRGWATGTRTAYLCGRILHPAAYEEITRARAPESSSYFPAYRMGEFARD
jgi:hypothetical protein